MNCTDCTAQLHGYLDRELTASETRDVETHVSTCPNCQRELAALRALVGQAEALPREIAPARDLWAEIDAKIRSETDSRSGAREALAEFKPRTTFAAWFTPLAIAAAVVLVFTLVQSRVPPRGAGSDWSIAPLTGAPRVGARSIASAAQLRVGQWIETDGSSRAEVSAGSVGRVTVDPNSRLRLATATEKDHRLDLARGSLSAFIWAPPRIFFVNTPSATAVDLGCAYTLKVDDSGNGELHVTLGYVALEHAGREALIPSGAMCLTRRGAGPGTPFAEDASASFRRALEQLDFRRENASGALSTILTEARPVDGLTLWHLLTRTNGEDRERVYGALALHHPPPAGVTREGILQGDATMRSTWGRELGLGVF